MTARQKTFPRALYDALGIDGRSRGAEKDQKHASAEKVVPFLKWAGGKRWLQPLADLIADLPYRRYFEPFVGSGAMFFALAPERATLSDSNKELIETYSALRDDSSAVAELLVRHDRLHSKAYYYEIRKSSPRSAIRRAARFIYLNRTCWNGLYRVNLSGEFNTPIGSKKRAVLATDDFDKVAQRLKRATLEASDFQEQIESARSGDLIFADPPYTVRHKNNGFLKYNENLFSWSDQIRLRDSLHAAGKRGVRVLCTNADHRSVRRLYADDFTVVPVRRFSAIASEGSRRGVFPELLIIG